MYYRDDTDSKGAWFFGAMILLIGCAWMYEVFGASL